VLCAAYHCRVADDGQELELARIELRSERRARAELARRAAELEERLERLTRESAAQLAELERDYQARLAEEARKSQRYLDMVAALRSSTSWRATRPLRALRRRVPGA